MLCSYSNILLNYCLPTEAGERGHSVFCINAAKSQAILQPCLGLPGFVPSRAEKSSMKWKASSELINQTLNPWCAQDLKPPEKSCKIKLGKWEKFQTWRQKCSKIYRAKRHHVLSQGKWNHDLSSLLAKLKLAIRKIFLFRKHIDSQKILEDRHAGTG